LNIRTSNLLLTAGSDAGIKTCFEAFTIPGSEVVYQTPTFAMVDVYAELFKVKKQLVASRPCQSDLADNYRSSISDKTALVIIANPNSPTGAVLSEKELEQVLEHSCAMGAMVLVDEAYFGFCEITAIRMISRFSNLVISRTFSKAFGLAGLRIGFLAGHIDLISTLTQYRPMYEITSVGAAVAKFSLHNYDLVAQYTHEVDEGRQKLVSFLNDRAIQFLVSPTNFLHIDLEDEERCVVFEKYLRDHNILGGKASLPLSHPTYARLTIGPPSEMRVLIGVIDSFWKS